MIYEKRYHSWLIHWPLIDEDISVKQLMEH